MENSWNFIKEIITNIQDINIDPAKYKTNQGWMTPEILEIMTERRNHNRIGEDYRKNINK